MFSHRNLGTPFPVTVEESLRAHHQSLAILLSPCKTQKKFGMFGSCQAMWVAVATSQHGREPWDPLLRESSHGVGTDASRAALGGGTGRGVPGEWQSLAHLRGAGSVGGTETGTELGTEQCRAAGGAMGAMGEQGTGIQVSWAGVAGRSGPFAKRREGYGAHGCLSVPPVRS